MDIAIWILTVPIVFVFMGTAVLKFVWNRNLYIEKMGKTAGWARYVSDFQFRAIAIPEVFGSLGLVLPRVTHTAEFLAPLAAMALGCMMFFAVVLLVKKQGTSKAIALPFVLIFMLLVLFSLYFV